MASGVITGASDSYVYLKISWSSTAGTGGSTVNASLIAQNGTHAYWYATINKSYSITIDGTTTTGSGSKLSSTQGGSSTLMSASKWVSYTGNKSITISGYADFNEVTVYNSSGVATGKLGTRSVSGTAALDKVGSKPPATKVSAPTTSIISETATSINVSWSKVTDYTGKATYTVQLSTNGGSYTTIKSGIANGTTSYTHTITAGQGNTYIFRVCAVNDVGSSDYAYSGTVTTNKLSPPTIGNLGVFNPYINSTYNVPLSGGSQTNGGEFTRRANIHVNGEYKYTGIVPISNNNTSVDITVNVNDIMADLPSNAYSSSTIFTIVAWTENSNGSRSGYVSKGFTVNINSDGGAAPVISAPIISGGSLGYDSTCFIAGVSKLTVTMGNVTLHRGSTSYDYKVEVTDCGSSGISPKTYENLTDGIKTITTTVTDNRGLSGSSTVQIMVQKYSPPTIMNIKGSRLNDNNTRATITYDTYFTPIYEYKDGINIPGNQINGINSEERSVDGGNWSSYSSGTLVVGLDTDNTYTIAVRIADKANPSFYVTESVLIPTIIVPIAFRRNRVGLNCVPQAGYALDVNGAVRVSGVDRNVILNKGAVEVIGVDGNKGQYNDGCIELSYTTPYIDFHYNRTTSDYDVRLINNKVGQLTLVGSLNVQGRITQMAYNMYANSDFNDFKESGIYICKESSGNANAPSTSTNGLLEVINHGNNLIIQKYTHYDGTVYKRVSWYGTWFAWRHNVDERDIYKSVTINSWNSMGLVRGDSSNIIIYLNGVYVGKEGESLKINGDVIIKTSATGNNITLNSPQADQYSWGVKIHSTTSGYGSIGACVFTSNFTLSKA